MKCTVPEMAWHNRDPVLCLDVHQCPPASCRDGLVYRLATGGSDSHVVVWRAVLDEDSSQVRVTAVADLTHHLKPVNAVRFSPSTLPTLASADDDGNILVWRRQMPTGEPAVSSDEQKPASSPQQQEADGGRWEEHYVIWKTLRGHLQDVADLCWSPDGSGLVSGAVDNTAIVWNVAKGVSRHILRAHDSFVQGVAWDPCDQFVATLGCDRYCRVFSVRNGRCLAKMYRCKVTPSQQQPQTPASNCDSSAHNDSSAGKPRRLFHDDTLQTFCRRASFTVDGSLLLAPAGLLETAASADSQSAPANVVHVFSRHDFVKPVYCMPTGKYTVAVRCCPVRFCLRSPRPLDPLIPAWQQTNTLLKLPYRMVVAVATRSSVLLFDTQQSQPFASISNIHFTRLTDLAWSSDGRLLCVSSTDGFCSLVTFSAGELGVPYVENVTPSVENVTPSVDAQPPQQQQADAADEMMPLDTPSAESQRESAVKEPVTEAAAVRACPVPRSDATTGTGTGRPSHRRVQLISVAK